jgi:hypothetical protein
MKMMLIALAVLVAFHLGPFANSDSATVYGQDHPPRPSGVKGTQECRMSALLRMRDLDLDDEPKTGCCCLLKDEGPPLVWDCTGYKDGTFVTEAQCKQDANDTSTKYKWHEGKCTSKD